LDIHVRAIFDRLDADFQNVEKDSHRLIVELDIHFFLAADHFFSGPEMTDFDVAEQIWDRLYDNYYLFAAENLFLEEYAAF
jgi:6-pyruvoyl-tetrahydropterin synthase